MKYQYMVAKGLLVPVKGTFGEDLLYKPSINGARITEWDNKPFHEFLNHFGAQGWEVVNIFSPAAGQGWCVVFKKIVEGES